MIKFGEHSLNTRRPADLDAALVAATGCNAAEHVAMLQRGGTAFQVAQALAPMLADSMPVGELAVMIGNDDLSSARMAVAELLAPVATAPAPKSEKPA